MKDNKNKMKTSGKKDKPSTNKKRASFKVKKVYSRKPKLSEINELNVMVVIVPREKEPHITEYILDNGGVILSKNRAKGVSRSNIFSGIGANETSVSVIFAIARSEDASTIITSLSDIFRLDIPGNGKAFMVDVLGYMGAKAPFIEKRTRR